MDDEFNVHEVTANDSPILACLHAETFPDTPWSTEWFRSVLSPPPVRAFLITMAAGPCGFAVTCVVAEAAEILTIGVLPGNRGKGVGGRLLRHLEEMVRGQGAEKLLLEVASDNHAARGLYQKAAFKQIGCRSGYYGNGTDALVLAKIF